MNNIATTQNRRKHRERRVSVLGAILDINTPDRPLMLVFTIISAGLLGIIWVIYEHHSVIRRSLIKMQYGLPPEELKFHAFFFILALIPWVGLLLVLSNVDWQQVSYIIDVFSKDDGN